MTPASEEEDAKFWDELDDHDHDYDQEPSQNFTTMCRILEPWPSDLDDL